MAQVITTHSLTRQFGEQVAVNQLTLEIERGEVFGLLGHNGAGKTTTVRLLNGVLEPTSGSCEVLGLNPVTQGAELRRLTGVLTETPSIEERLSAQENLSIYGDLYGVPAQEKSKSIDRLLEMFDLADRRKERTGGYSKGMKQRLALARTLLHEPELLFFDEPTSGLDPIASKQVRDLILMMSQEQGRTVVVATHNLVEAQRLCDRVGVLEHGRLLAVGTPGDLARQLGDRARVEIEVASEQLQKAQKILSALPHGEQVVIEHHQLAVLGAERRDTPAFVNALVEDGIDVFAVKQGEPSLEDIYFALHKENGVS